MNNKIVWILILSVAAVVLVMVVNNVSERPASPTRSTPPATTRPPAATPPASSTSAAKQKALQQLIADSPGADATSAQLADYSGRVFQASVESSTLDVTNCTPEPGVLRVKIGQTIKLKNQDPVTHKVTHGQFNFEALAKSETSVRFDVKSPGIYTYACDTRIVGIIMAIQ